MAEESTRINLVVGSDIPELLTHLAGGERRRGEYVTRLVRSIYAGENAAKGTPATSEAETLRLAIVGLLSRLKGLEDRVFEAEAHAEQIERTMAGLNDRLVGVELIAVGLTEDETSQADMARLREALGHKSVATTKSYLYARPAEEAGKA